MTCVKPFQSHSQAGQDRFVHALIPGNDGTFLDIGGSHPIICNNTYGLEQIGWHGLIVDIKGCPEGLETARTSPYVRANAVTMGWDAFLGWQPGKKLSIDYLSLDVDDDSFEVLIKLPHRYVRFSIITFEHDYYRLGDSLRNQQRDLLSANDYVLVCADVMCDGLVFEDWWVDPDRFDFSSYERFMCEGKDWKSILSNQI
jgi:hypothetical protein